MVHLGQVLLKESNTAVIDHEDTETKIVAIHQNSLWYREANELLDFGELSILYNDLLMLSKVEFSIKEADIDGLLSKHFISMFAKSLSNLETLDNSIFLGVLV